jgi:hypothetical protein
VRVQWSEDKTVVVAEVQSVPCVADIRCTRVQE